MKVKIFAKNEVGEQLSLPEYKTPEAAGVDLKSLEKCTLLPGHPCLVKTGLYMEIPAGYEGQVRPRSGLALKKGITVLNAPGTIDSDYRGEVGVILMNHTNVTVELEAGERVAQIVFATCLQAEFETVEKLEDLSGTERGEGGFGSTGTK